MSGSTSGTPIPMLTQSDIDRFWAKVNCSGHPDSCWIWEASKNQQGYGNFQLARGGKKNCLKSHRVAWSIINGSIPDGMVVMHECDNTSCVNPNHLKAATQSDNSLDSIRKNRSLRYGSNNGKSKLSEMDCAEIRSAYRPGEYGLVKSLADRFGVEPQTIHSVVNKSTWKHL